MTHLDLLSGSNSNDIVSKFFPAIDIKSSEMCLFCVMFRFWKSVKKIEKIVEIKSTISVNRIFIVVNNRIDKF